MARSDAHRRGLLLDYGGVLTTSIFGSFTAYCEREGMEGEAVRDHLRHPGPGQDLLVAFEEGRIADAEFEERFAEVLGVSPWEGLIGRLQADVRLDATMTTAVRAAHAAGVRTGLISNSWGTDFYDRDLFDEAFDVLVISAEEGIRKPAPEIYATAVERMGMPAEELVFVDDLGHNLKPARALGMATIKHVDPDHTVAELEQVLGVMLRACPGPSS